MEDRSTDNRQGSCCEGRQRIGVGAARGREGSTLLLETLQSGCPWEMVFPERSSGKAAEWKMGRRRGGEGSSAPWEGLAPAERTVEKPSVPGPPFLSRLATGGPSGLRFRPLSQSAGSELQRPSPAVVSGRKAVSGLGLGLGLGVRGRPRGMPFPPDSISCLFFFF